MPNQNLGDADFYFDIGFLKFRPKPIFWANLSRKIRTVYVAWKLTHRVSHRDTRGCDCKDIEEGLEAKLKMNDCIKYLLLVYFYRS